MQLSRERFCTGDDFTGLDPPLSLFSIRVDDESRDREGVDEIPNIGLKGEVVRKAVKSSSVAAAIVDGGFRWDARSLFPNGEFLRPDMVKKYPLCDREGERLNA
jgi:hypothetical protein